MIPQGISLSELEKIDSEAIDPNDIRGVALSDLETHDAWSKVSKALGDFAVNGFIKLGDRKEARDFVKGAALDVLSLPQDLSNILKSEGEKSGFGLAIPSLIDGVTLANEMMGKKSAGLYSPLDTPAKEIAGFVSTKSQEYINKLNLKPESEDSIFFDLGQGASSMAMSLGLMYATRNPALVASLFGARQKGRIYSEARKAGKGIGESSLASTFAGIIEGGVESIGGIAFLKSVSFDKALTRGIARAAIEGIEEGTQQIGEEAVAKFFGIRNDSIRDISLRIGYASMLGFILGAPAGVVTTQLEKSGLIKEFENVGFSKSDAKKIIKHVNEKVIENGELHKAILTHLNNEAKITDTELNTYLPTAETAEQVSTEQQEETQQQIDTQEEIVEGGVSVPSEEMIAPETESVNSEAELLEEAKKYKSAEEFVASNKLPTDFLRDESNMAEGFNVRKSGDLRGYGKEEPLGTWEDFKKSIKEEGIKNPVEIYIDKDGKIEIVEGTHRLLAASELGIKEVPYVARGNTDKLKSQLTDIYNKAQSELSPKDGEQPTGGTPVKPPTQPPVAESAEFPEEPAKDDSELINKIINALKSAKDIRAQQETINKKERAKRFAKMMGQRESKEGEAGFFAEKGALKGEFKKVEFESLRGQVTQEDVDRLFNMINESDKITEWEKLTAKEGLASILGEVGGKVPTKGEISKLQKVFGKELVDAILEKRTFLQKALEAGYQIANIPRSIMSSFDLSYGLRQGVFVATRYRKQWFEMFVKQFELFGSEKAFTELQDIIRKSPDYELAVESGVAFAEMDTVIDEREERFASQWAEKIPVVGGVIRASARAYTGFANKLRSDIFSILVKDAEKAGLNPQENLDLTKKIASFVNAATGRGDLHKEISGSANLLNALFFSPRLMASRLTLLNPYYYITLPPNIRKEAFKTLGAFMSTGLIVLGLSKLMGAEVGIDPRSSDFGKIKLGNTRVDIWGGFQQYARMLGQLISGQYVSSTTGKVVTLGEGYRPLTRLEIIQRQLESKESPIASFVTTLLKGQTWDGKKINLTNEILNRLTPMTISSLIDSLKIEPEHSWVNLLAPFGVGVQTYEKKKRKE